MVARIHKETINRLMANGVSKEKVTEAYTTFMNQKDLFDKKNICFTEFFSKKANRNQPITNKKAEDFLLLLKYIENEDFISKIKKRILGERVGAFLSKGIEKIIIEEKDKKGKKYVFDILKKGLKHKARIENSDQLKLDIIAIFRDLTIESLKEEIEIHNKKNGDTVYLEHAKDDIYYIRFSLETVVLFQKLASPTYCTQKSYEKFYSELMHELSFLWCFDFSEKGRYKQFIIQARLPAHKDTISKEQNGTGVTYSIHDYYNKRYNMDSNYKDKSHYHHFKTETDEKVFDDMAKKVKKVIPPEKTNNQLFIYNLFKYKENVSESWSMSYGKEYAKEYAELFNLTVYASHFDATKKLLNKYKPTKKSKNSSYEVYSSLIKSYIEGECLARPKKMNEPEMLELLEMLPTTQRSSFFRSVREDLIYETYDELKELKSSWGQEFVNIFIKELELERNFPISMRSVEDMLMKLVFDTFTVQEKENIKSGGISFYLLNDLFENQDGSVDFIMKILRLMTQEQQKEILRLNERLEIKNLKRLFEGSFADLTKMEKSCIKKEEFLALKRLCIELEAEDEITVSKKHDLGKEAYENYLLEKEKDFEIPDYNGMDELLVEISPQMDLFETYGYYDEKKQ